MTNTLFNVEAYYQPEVKYVSDPYWDKLENEETSSVRESSFTAEENDSLTTHSINIYKPSGKARGQSKYFRYSYRDGKRTKHIHIPGGNTSSPLARQRAKIIDDAIAQKTAASEIVKMIREFKV